VSLMPKPKPTQVIRFEVVLGRREFELMETLSAAMSINKVSQPVVEILKDNSALLAVAGILEAAGFIDVIPAHVVQAISAGAYTTLEAVLAAIKDAIRIADDAIDAAVELTEDIAEKGALIATKASNTEKAISRAWGTALWLSYAALPGGTFAMEVGAPFAPSWFQPESPFRSGR